MKSSIFKYNLNAPFILGNKNKKRQISVSFFTISLFARHLKPLEYPTRHSRQQKHPFPDTVMSCCLHRLKKFSAPFLYSIRFPPKESFPSPKPELTIQFAGGACGKNATANPSVYQAQKSRLHRG
ncbi:MAG: hypothetical protein MR397_04240 [Oscillospiraceae bacterium]|nr:hypothetical protein [Oscillospiraceae bacterium]